MENNSTRRKKGKMNKIFIKKKTIDEKEQKGKKQRHNEKLYISNRISL